MKFFIDTANLDQIREANELGVLDGVTTNPSLMAKEGIKGVENLVCGIPSRIWEGMAVTNFKLASAGHSNRRKRIVNPIPV